jgi:hypothetical protein
MTFADEMLQWLDAWYLADLRSQLTHALYGGEDWTEYVRRMR